MPHVHSMNELVESDHKALLRALAELETAFREPELAKFDEWKLERLWQLRDFLNLLQKHFDLEETGGFNAKMSRMAPHLCARIEQLEEDHRKISSDLNHIIDVMKGTRQTDSAKLERIQQRVEELVQFIRSHEAAETDVIQEAFYQEMGLGD